KMIRTITVLLILGLAGSIAGCKLLHSRFIEIVVRDSVCVEFEEREDSAQFTTPATVDVAEELDEALSGVGLTRADITGAKLLAGSYTVTMLQDVGHDWEISGTILVQRDDISDGPEIIVDYSSQSLEDALAAGEIFADLNPAGVELFNRALDDYRENMYTNPILTFTVSNDTCTPAPTGAPADSLIFNWTGCMYMYVIVEEELTVFDPL
ncbi:MAG: hypothetical protein KAW67_00170, partial [Candidatus Eisenbacteria sp.]|nr:hypothetical protein [Candidatus Eisenbacteria bacterium]